jgi:hypothetical protein
MISSAGMALASINIIFLTSFKNFAGSPVSYIYVFLSGEGRLQTFVLEFASPI